MCNGGIAAGRFFLDYPTAEGVMEAVESAPHGQRGGGGQLSTVCVNQISLKLWEKWWVTMRVVNLEPMVA